MITFKLNLMQYKAAIQKIKNKQGFDIECVVIPIALNDLFKGDKGVYADFVAYDYTPKDATNKNTHLIKQSLPKDKLKAMTDEEKKSLPIFGDLRVWSERTDEPASDMKPIGENDPLPWD